MERPAPESEPERESPAPAQAALAGTAPSIGAPAGRLLWLQQTAGNRAVGRMLARMSPQEVIAEHAGWLDQSDLGAELRRRALAGELDLVGQVLDGLSWFSRHNAALSFAGPGSDAEIEQLAETAAGRAVLDRVLDELSRVWGGEEETAAAERLMRARAARLTPEQVERGVLAAKVFPFRLPGLTVVQDAPITAERRPGNSVWVSLPPRVTGSYPEETADLPWEVFGPGIVLPEDEIVGVRMYDLGGEVMYRPAIFLVQLNNQTDAQILETMATTAGLALGGAGGAAEAGAGLAARLLVVADRIAFGVGAIAAVVKEHRGWILSEFGDDGKELLRYVDIVNSVVAVYGGVRALAEMGQLVLGLRRAILDWRSAAALKAELSAGEQAVVAGVSQHADDVVEQIDEAVPPQQRTTPDEAPAPARSTAAVRIASLLSDQQKKQVLEFFYGPMKQPKLADLEPLLDDVWARLGGVPADVPTIQTRPMDAEGWFKAWQYQFGTISLNSKVQSAGQAANTVYHEAMHARLRVMFPWLRENSPTYSPAKAVLFRHFDEILAYAYGGVGQVRHGATKIDQLEGLANITFSPWLAYGSANNFWEAVPGLVRDAMLLTMLAMGMLAITVAAGAAALLACFGLRDEEPIVVEPVIVIEPTTPGP
jgi:hypothetical protein